MKVFVQTHLLITLFFTEALQPHLRYLCLKDIYIDIFFFFCPLTSSNIFQCHPHLWGETLDGNSSWRLQQVFVSVSLLVEVECSLRGWGAISNEPHLHRRGSDFAQKCLQIHQIYSDESAIITFFAHYMHPFCGLICAGFSCHQSRANFESGPKYFSSGRPSLVEKKNHYAHTPQHRRIRRVNLQTHQIIRPSPTLLSGWESARLSCSVCSLRRQQQKPSVVVFFLYCFGFF